MIGGPSQAVDVVVEVVQVVSGLDVACGVAFV